MLDREKRLDKALEKFVEDGEIPGGAQKKKKNGKLVYERCVGYGDIEKKIPVRADTIYRMCSMTKLLTAVCAMQLVERGNMSLDDNLGKWFPDFRDDLKKITVRHLLNHSCGIGQGPKSAAYYEKHCVSGDTLAERVNRWRNMPLDFPVGSSPVYSPVIAFDLLGRIIEITGREPLQSYMEQNLFEPLEMEDSTFHLSQEQRKRKALLYEKEENGLREVADERAVKELSFVYDSGCGGVYSTLRDYGHFTEMLAAEGCRKGRRVIGEKSLRLMRTTGQITDRELRPGCRWGLGFLVVENPELAGRAVGKGSFGWSGAYGTHMYVDPVNGISVTFLTGRRDIGGADSPVSRALEELISPDRSSGKPSAARRSRQRSPR